MTFRVIILPRAIAEIEANAQWWAVNHSIRQAVVWFELVYQQLHSIALQPESHALSEENGKFRYEIRDRLLGSGFRPTYRAVFTIRGDTIYILTVRRGSQGRLRPDEVQFPEDP
jgi:plasmid stabilization system protein ParE